MSENIDNIPPYICKLADGSTLRAKYPGEKRNQMYWSKNWLTARCIELAHSKNKKSRPILGFLNSGTDHCLLGADFDTIPGHLGIKEGTDEALQYWDNFAIECQKTYSQRAIVARSCSWKVKVIFPIKLPPFAVFNKKAQILGLEQILTKEHFEMCDTSANSTNLTYLTPSLIGNLQYIQYLEPILLNLPVENNSNSATVFDDAKLEQSSTYTSESNNQTMDHIVQPTTVDVSSIEYKINKYSILPELETKLCYWNSTANRTMFLNKLVAMWGLLSRTGFQISMKKMAEECGVSIECVSKYLKYFIKKGLLRCVNKKYKPHLIARTYKASGTLRKAITRHMELVKSGTSVFRSKLPKKIKDGQWEKKLYYMKFMFNTAKEYMSYVSKIPGFFRKDRRAKAERIAKRFFTDSG